MRVLVLCRFQKNSNDPVFQEIEEELSLQRTMQNDFDQEKEREKLMATYNIYDYAPMMLSLKDVCTTNYIDAKHTSIRLYNGNNYTIKIKFEDFVTIYENLTSSIVNDFTSVVFAKQTKPQTIIFDATTK